MSQPDTDFQEPTTGKEKVRRRGFVKTLAAIGGAAFVWRTTGGNNAVAATQTTATSPNTFASLAASALKLPKAYEDYSKPSYVPSDYQLTEVYNNRLDGFGKGSSELAFWLTKRKRLVDLEPNQRHAVGW